MSGNGYELINDTVKNDPKQITTLVEYVSGSVDSIALQSCIESQKYTKSIERDITENSKLKFSGTPHFVVNGQIFRGAVDFNTIKSALK